jgi:2TM domain
MPPKLYRPPDPNDPEYQRLERRINFALHVGIFAASNSCMWFIRSVIYANWEWTFWLTGGWAMLLLGHGSWLISREKGTEKS